MIMIFNGVNVDDRWVPFPGDKAQPFPEAYQWTRIRDELANPYVYGAGIADDQVLKALESLDRRIIEGVMEVNRLIKYYSGILEGAGVKMIPGVGKMGVWLDKQIDNTATIYGCYKKVLRP